MTNPEPSAPEPSVDDRSAGRVALDRRLLAEAVPLDAVVTRELSYCHEDNDVADVRTAMAERHLREIPVLLHRGFPRVVGIVSIHDLAPSPSEWKH